MGQRKAGKEHIWCGVGGKCIEDATLVGEEGSYKNRAVGGELPAEALVLSHLIPIQTSISVAVSSALINTGDTHLEPGILLGVKDI